MTTDSAFLKDQRLFNERLIQTLDSFGIPYAIGGSMAAMSYSKSARFTIDVDLMMTVDQSALQLLVSEVERWQLYIDPLESIFEFSLPSKLPINVVDGLLGTKADLYVAGPAGLDASAMSRRRKRVLYVDPDFEAWFLAPEDVILYKLDYFKQSEGTASKHPTDIHNMLRVVSAELDTAYLEYWAREFGVLDLWLALWDEFQK
jgi:hypothetical protein